MYDITLLEIPQIVGIAFAVLSDKYGTGEERKAKLKAEGYNAQKVQNCVNDLLKLFDKYSEV